MPSPEEILMLSREDLLKMIFDLRSENSSLREQLRSIHERASTDLCSSPQLKEIIPINNDTARYVDPEDSLISPRSSTASTSGRINNNSKNNNIVNGNKNKYDRLSYEISLSVLVIEDGAVRCVPMSAMLDKTYRREDLREADTPALTERSLRDDDDDANGGSVIDLNADPSDHSPQKQRFSRMSCGFRLSDDFSFRTNLEEELSSGINNRELENTLLAKPERCAAVEASTADEPLPHPPYAEGYCTNSPGRGSDAGASAIHALARRAGVVSFEAYRGLLREGRELSLDSDAIVSEQTLRLFNWQFGRAPSPVSPAASAVYAYLVRTFAVRNGCRHGPDDVSRFGRALLGLCGEVERLLEDEPRHGATTSPCYVFGDLHGNFRDLFYFMENLVSFQELRYTPHRFLFLGDYVDRGEFSVEVLGLVFAMKALAPGKVLLLRGNHEDTRVSGDVAGYGGSSFRAQCHALLGAALGEELWERASEAFTRLPLTASLDGRIFCTHGGPPRYAGGPDDRLALLRSPAFPPMRSFFDVPADESEQRRRFRLAGLDACWADPAEDESRLDEWGFGANPRGSGVVLFGSKAVDDFLDHFHYELIFRAHQEKSDGLKLSKSARVFTIFSTSAYVGHQNGAGVVLVADNKIRLIVKAADTYPAEQVDDDALLRIGEPNENGSHYKG